MVEKSKGSQILREGLPLNRGFLQPKRSPSRSFLKFSARAFHSIAVFSDLSAVLFHSSAALRQAEIVEADIASPKTSPNMNMNMTSMDEAHITVRTGTPVDVHKIMALALAACEENGLTDPDPERLLQEIWPALHLEGGIIGVIGEPAEPLQAAILLRVDCMWYSRAKTLLERAIFVHPDHRKSKVGRAKLLCEFAKKAAHDLSMPLVIGVLSNQRTEAKSRLYSRQFGDPAGVYFIYNGKTGTA